MKSDDPILNTPHFRDFIDTPHLFDDRERLPGPDGVPGKGLRLREAVPLAELWWERVARFQMPDHGKDPHQQIVKSGIMMGLPWDNLDKQEKLRVLAQWYAHVGVHTILEQRQAPGDVKPDRLDKIKKKGTEMFKVLDPSSTHRPIDDKIETETWRDGYDEIEHEKRLEQQKGKDDGNEETETSKAEGSEEAE